MFGLSSKGDYGILSILELSLNYNKSHIQIKDIAKKQKIPQHYLEQLLLLLKKSKFVKSFRGASGGYALAKHPSKIKIIDILIVLEGEIELIKNKKNKLFFFWKDKKNEICKLFDISFEELVIKYQNENSEYIYNI